MAPYIENDTSTGDTSPARSSSYDSSNYEQEPIAIVGMGCRLPGGVRCPLDLWKLLVEDRSGQCDVPASRWNIDAFYHPNLQRPGSMNTKGGYFIQEDIRNFDNAFFGINNLEATYMDPQQRKLLEVCYECFESAGVPMESVSGANIGCYVGNFTTDYVIMQAKQADNLHRYSATGMGTTILSNRISHVFNLTGPSVVIDTACSSSLYSVHMACQAILAGECEGAIAAGANLMQTPEQHLGTMKAGVLSATSTCHTFDSSADGYGRAEGVGAVYLKKLSKALENNDPIRAVIRGSAVNANGKTNGITLPSADGQEAVIRKAYKKAGLEKALGETSYVECHGTGTPVGDPIEVEAVSRVFKRASNEPLLIGSVKTNLGHSEAASGYSSIFKVVYALEQRSIPATIGVVNVNPKIKTREWGVQIVTKKSDWPASLANQVARASINSFGYGGANSHVILESSRSFSSPKLDMSSEDLSQRRSRFLLPLSANSSASLQGQIEKLSSVDLASLNVVDLAYTLGVRRSKLEIRAFTVASQKSLKSDLKPEHAVMKVNNASSKLPFAFIFTGQGAQWPQMGKELIEEFPSFNQDIVDLDEVLQTLPEAPSWTLRQAILDPKDTSQISHVTRSQPVCTAIQIAYVNLLGRWGIKPDTVVGHSSGEIAAAFAAGFLTAAEAIIVAYYRGYVVNNNEYPMEGAMIAVGLDAKGAQQEITSLELDHAVKIACLNSPENITASGDAESVDRLSAKLQEKGVFARKLNTNGRAYHSHHMSTIGSEYTSLLEANLPRSHTVKTQATAQWISSVTGQLVVGQVAPAYWSSNLQSPVRFSDAVEGVVKLGYHHMIEIGPHSALELPIKQTVAGLKSPENGNQYSSVLTRGKDAGSSLLSMMGGLWLAGHNIDFAKVNYVEPEASTHLHRGERLGQGKVIPDLPPYSWTYESLLWSEGRSSQEFRQRQHPHHDILGVQIPGGDGVHSMWINRLKVDNLSWLQDHKLEATIVFPGAGYLAMAIEAVRQVSGVRIEDAPSFELREVQVLKVLMLSGERSDPGVEIFTSVSPMAISGTTKSKRWWEFEITSFKDQASTVHATGRISVGEAMDVIASRYLPANVDLETQAARNWYKQFVQVGLNFGPAFTSLRDIRTPRSRNARHIVAKTALLQGGGYGESSESRYPIHPITIDALLQAGIIASTKGVVKDLGPHVPVSIEEVHLQSPSTAYASELWTIDAFAERVGFSSITVSSTLHDAHGHPICYMKNVHATEYQGAADLETPEDREPMLRLLWKPDIQYLTNEDFGNYLRSSSELNAVIAALDLLCHQNPSLHILEMAPTPQIASEVIATMTTKSSSKPFKSYTQGQFIEGEILVVQAVEGSDLLEKPNNVQRSREGGYDIIFVPSVSDDYDLATLATFLAPDGMLLHVEPYLPQKRDGFSTIAATAPSGMHIAISTPVSADQDEGSKDRGHNILIVHAQEQTAFDMSLCQQLARNTNQHIRSIALQGLKQDQLQKDTTVVSTFELSRPVMSTLTADAMGQVKLITDNALKIIWITGGSMFHGGNPDFALISGLSRALMLEQPSLKFFTLDLSSAELNSNEMQTVSSFVDRIHQGKCSDFEYAMHNGMLHVSRMVPDGHFNQIFREKQGELSHLMPLEDAKPCRLEIGKVGQFDTLAFVQEDHDTSELSPGTVEVEVKSVGLNAKDYFALAGKVETKDAGCKLECSGIVTRVAVEGVKRLSVGDRVVVMGPGHFLTHERFHEWACHKLLDGEDFNTAATLPIVFSTAIYGLHHRGNIQDGESVLIHSAAGGLGIAAIQIAKAANAQIFATVGTEAKKNYLVEEFGLRRDRIFSSRDPKFLPQLLAATGGRGVDIVLNSLTGDLLHDSWRACAPFGRFVEVGKRDIVDAGKLDMAMFARNVTFTAFDLSHLYDENNPKLCGIWSSLLAETMSLYRQKKIKAVEPLKTFAVSQIVQAYRHFGLGSRLGKVAVSLENPAALIPTLPRKYNTTFSPSKAYIMVGCLGGLGRSVSKWMVKRGAKKFIFIGRSGTDKKPAQLLVDDLQSSGAEVQVVRGDVAVFADVQAAVKLAKDPVGGVIQAAMGLNESLWTSMPIEYWHTGIDPKLIGSWNLYHALEGRTCDLDFFLMTSSVSGSVGTATEGNYCAANYFLDVFARFLKQKGLPGISIGLGMISEVGYLHENPEIEALLLRKGIQAINEDELLQIIDISLSQSSPTTYDSLASGHVLTGLEALGLKKLREAGFSGSNPTLNDPRAVILASALDSETDMALKSQNLGLPAELKAAIEARESRDAIVLAGLSSIVSRFSNLVLLQPDKIDVNKTLASFGMDSMLAAEFRTWFYQAFKVDVPFLTLLAETTTLRVLGEMVHDEICRNS